MKNLKKSQTKFNEWLKDFDTKLLQLRRKLTNLEKSANANGATTGSSKPATHTTNLNREMSYSDSLIYYQASYSSAEEGASGSTGLINLDGSLNLNMILKGAHSVLLKENSNKLCELSLNILENLISIDLLPSEEIDRKLEQAKVRLTLSHTSNIYLDDLEKKYAENFHLAADLALRYSY